MDSSALITGSNPPPPPGIPREAWKKMPLAKRRLLSNGPQAVGRNAFGTAVIAVAAEMCLQGIPEKKAAAACRQMPFTEGATLRSKVLKNVDAWVTFAYHPPDGEPILSGCPRTRRGGTDEKRSTLRDIFKPYCDQRCMTTCSSFKLNRMPEMNLMGTSYEPTIMSDLWMSGVSGGLNTDTRQVYAVLASMAVAERSDKVLASGAYLTRRLGGRFPARTLRWHLAKLSDHGIIATMNRRTGLRWVPPLAEDVLEALQTKLGVSEAAKWNIIEANWDSLRKAEEWPTWDVSEALGGSVD